MGFIRLGGDRTKNKIGRVIPLHHPRIVEFLQSCPRPIHGGYVFGENRRFNRKAYNKAVKAAGIVDFNFHDLRHCAINNLRLAGNDHYKIKQASGHKTDSAFPAIQFSNRRRDERDAMTGSTRRKIGDDRHLYGHHSKNKYFII